jgi:hypothetical protein
MITGDTRKVSIQADVAQFLLQLIAYPFFVISAGRCLGFMGPNWGFRGWFHPSEPLSPLYNNPVSRATAQPNLFQAEQQYTSIARKQPQKHKYNLHI